jgi:hypothetical protein
MTANQAGHDEIVLFTEKPNALLYALEVTRHNLLFWSAAGGIPLICTLIYTQGSLLSAGVLVLITYFLLGLFLLIVAFVTACCLMFVLTNKRAIVRFSFWRMTTDGLSIAIETVRCIEIYSYGATHGNVYLNSDKTSPRENSKSSEPQPEATRRASNELAEAPVPIKRTASLWGSMSNWPRLLGFYGFKGFDEFANIISEQQKRRSEFQRGR